MPINKNAMTRYIILDELLSDKCHNYTMDDLTDVVNSRFRKLYPDHSDFTRRCIEKDIYYMEYEGPWMVEIERTSVAFYNGESNKTVTKKCLKYADPSFSIFKKEMTDDEKYILSESLSMLGQFEGMPEFESLENLRKSMNVEERSQIVSFSKNPLEGKTVFGELFSAISHKQVVELHYHKFNDAGKNKLTVYPYLLKEYNNRWFLIAAAEGETKLLTFALDRLDKVKPLSSHLFVEYDGDINEMYEDIIGVTYYEENPLQKIVFWVSDYSKDYVKTKPIHESQTKMREQPMRERYPDFKGGAFFRIECKENYELIRELTSFGEHLVVLEPSNIRDKIVSRIESMRNKYGMLK